jgi:hypothetical protein
MHANLLMAVLLIVGAVALYRWLLRTHPTTVRRYGKKAALWGGLTVLALLVATGRISWLLALIGSIFVAAQRLLPLLRLAPVFQWANGQFRGGAPFGKASNPSPGQSSQVDTAYLRMRLDHDSGEMGGEVLKGRYRGKSLETLSLTQLLDLMRECVIGDPQSGALLESYLDRAHGPEWRDTWDQQSTASGQVASMDGPMSHAEAHQILGLKPGADATAIRDAHRRLMQKLHPDRGGSSYLATKINQAKDLLLA